MSIFDSIQKIRSLLLGPVFGVCSVAPALIGQDLIEFRYATSFSLIPKHPTTPMAGFSLNHNGETAFTLTGGLRSTVGDGFAIRVDEHQYTPPRYSDQTKSAPLFQVNHDFRVRIYKDGGTEPVYDRGFPGFGRLDLQLVPIQAQLDIDFSFQDGALYAVIAGYADEACCGDAAVGFRLNWPLTWPVEPTATPPGPPFRIDETTGYTCAGAWQNDGPRPRHYFYYDSRPLPIGWDLAASQGALWQGDFATNYGATMATAPLPAGNFALPEVWSWSLFGAEGHFLLGETRSQATSGPFVFNLPDFIA